MADATWDPTDETLAEREARLRGVVADQVRKYGEDNTHVVQMLMYLGVAQTDLYLKEEVWSMRRQARKTFKRAARICDELGIGDDDPTCKYVRSVYRTLGQR